MITVIRFPTVTFPSGTNAKIACSNGTSIVPITGTFCLITILETSNPTNDFPFPSIPTIIPSGAASDGSLENI